MALKQHDFFFISCLVLFFLVFPYIIFPMSAVNVGTLNLNGARGIEKRALLFELIKHKNLQVTFVQETHSDALMKLNGGRNGRVRCCLRT